MYQTYKRIEAHFYRVSLHSETDNMTMALVPDMEHAHLIASLLTKNYRIHPDEKIIVTPTVIRPVKSDESAGVEIGIV